MSQTRCKLNIPDQGAGYLFGRGAAVLDLRAIGVYIKNEISRAGYPRFPAEINLIQHRCSCIFRRAVPDSRRPGFGSNLVGIECCTEQFQLVEIASEEARRARI